MIAPDKRIALIQERQHHARTKGCRQTPLLDHRCDWCIEADRQLSISHEGWYLSAGDRKFLKSLRIAPI